ncbi:folylpolyglutamate synthase/dihydrofolate synthase family protein [Deinococcus sp. DB0503]|uniref:bifunctional folylpolyglutamate synthase/dihydrofolate synthase n=1 Tax=Deinococcus sp. DB0503 TaxID=2479203 RepID=UPI0018DF1651|nr:folylpolyglutamate synthase/dihydrofolate synthase family protein [Deinococcus sp. DB0503]MBI0446557.1 bifunctional folylpolyglutamate synthase/dihydrofolate synthase [Deinococcus sp. DB0503]
MTDLDWLFARQRFGVHPGLTRVQVLLARLGDPQQAFRTVLVGGTNGKGSTAATLAAILTAGGERAGLFTSPHLTRFSERFVVAGRELPEATVLGALRRVRPHAETAEASFFEIVTVLGCLLFAEAGVTTAVMEVGLGGRLDATNALDPQLSVITNVGLDHTEILGETREAIAREKAGILRAGHPAVTGVAEDLLPVLEAWGADLWSLGREVRLETLPLGWDGWEVGMQLPEARLNFRTPLLGPHGARNAALAAAAAHRLGLDNEVIQEGTRRVYWPGRLELLPWRGGRVLLDGAHNPDGAQALVEALWELGGAGLPMIFGVAADKDIAGVAAALRPLASEVILTRTVLSPRAADPAALAPYFAGVPVQLASTPADALDRLPPAGLTVVCGSLYLVGEVRPLLLGEVDEGRERWQ